MNNQKAEQVLETVGIYSAISKGTSMWPMLANGTNRIIIVKPESEPKLYDVALFRRDSGVLVLHRIVEVHNDYFEFCGDDQTVHEKVRKEQVLGVLKGYHKGKKYIDCEKNRLYLFYVRFWTFMKPVRKQLLSVMWFFKNGRYRLGKILSKIITLR